MTNAVLVFLPLMCEKKKNVICSLSVLCVIILVEEETQEWRLKPQSSGGFLAWFVLLTILSAYCLGVSCYQERNKRRKKVPGIEQHKGYRIYRRRKYFCGVVALVYIEAYFTFCLFGCEIFQNLCKAINCTFSLYVFSPPKVSFSRPLFYLFIFVFISLAFLQ